MSSIQKTIDSLVYPPTMTYDYATLTPTNVLKERIDILNANFPTFLGGDCKNYLDVGCNKGWFSALFGLKGANVVGFDTDKRFIDLCKNISEDQKFNGEFYLGGFRDLHPVYEFDRIYMGNVMHYIFNEFNGWSFIDKLAAITSPGGELVIEGGIDITCNDMKNAINPSIHSLFKKDIFLKIMSKYFEFVGMTNAVSYTPERYVVAFKRKQDCYNSKQEIEQKSFRKEIRINLNHDRFDSHRIRHRIASMCQSYSNMIGIEGNIAIDEKSTTPEFDYGINEKEVLLTHFKGQLWLLNSGYLDLDVATINAAYFGDKIKIFDKSEVFHLDELQEDSNNHKESYGICYDRFTIVDEEALEDVKKAIQKMDRNGLIEHYSKAIEKLVNNG